MRFETISALVIGVLLPFLETYRRGISHWSIDFTTMFEDYVAGVLLLIAGWASYRSHRWGVLLLVVAWAYVAAMMSGSFWYQLENTLRDNILEQNNSLVVTVKFLLWSIAVGSLILSFRTALRMDQRND
jgi:glucan phosphoethanolaminetransferase (alkaline phosphatase superfamily)